MCNNNNKLVFIVVYESTHLNMNSQIRSDWYAELLKVERLLNAILILEIALYTTISAVLHRNFPNTCLFHVFQEPDHHIYNVSSKNYLNNELTMLPLY